MSLAAPRGEMHMSWITSKLAIPKLTRNSTTAAPVIIITAPYPTSTTDTGGIHPALLFIQLGDSTERTSSPHPQSLGTRNSSFTQRLSWGVGPAFPEVHLLWGEGLIPGRCFSQNAPSTAWSVLRGEVGLPQEQSQAGAGSGITRRGDPLPGGGADGQQR